MKTLVVIGLIAGTCLSLNAVGADQYTWKRDVPFISPIGPRLTLPLAAPQRRAFCRSTDRRQCPKLLANEGSGQGGIPNFDPPLKARIPHVRVSFVLQRLQIIGDAAAWLEPSDVDGDFSWETHSNAADLEEGSFQIQYNGEADAAGYLYTPVVIYDALVLNACNSFSSFPVEHYADFFDSYGVITPFSGYDDSTINSTGFYSFSYAIQVDSEPGDGEKHSGIQLSGKVNAVCTAMSSL